MKSICTDPFFDLFIILCILVNTGFLAAEWEPMEPYHEMINIYSNYVSQEKSFKIWVLFKFKLIILYTCCITPKRVTSSRDYHRVIAPR